MTIRPPWVSRTRRISNSRGCQVDAASRRRGPRGARRRGRAGRRGGAPLVAAGPGGMPQRHADPGVQLVDAERLRDVVVGSALERLDLLPFLEAAGQDHDRRGRLTPDPPRSARPVHVRQAQVEQHEVRAAGLPAPSADRAVLGLAGPVAARRSSRTSDGRVSLVVLDDQDRRRRPRHRAGRSRHGARTRPSRAREPAGSPRQVRGRSARPPSSLRRAATRPPIASTRPRTTARPIPCPPRDRRCAGDPVELLEQAAARRPARPGRRPRRSAGPVPLSVAARSRIRRVRAACT